MIKTPNHATAGDIEELWKPIKGYEGIYEISSLGRVKSLPRKYRKTEKFLSTRPDKKGYHRAALTKNGKARERKVHQLVLEAFVGPRPKGTQACHWDDDRTNNSVENLRWGTPSENLYDRVRNNRHFFANKTHCLRGHKLSGGNLYEYGGQRVCKSCSFARGTLHRRGIKKDERLIRKLSDQYYEGGRH